MEKIIKKLASELNINKTQVRATVSLLEDGNTVPFIARYRKEATGGLTDEDLRELSERLTYLKNLSERKNEVKSLLNEMGKLSSSIERALDKAGSMQEVEDIYRPYRPKRKTRASVAREQGLAPLAKKIFSQDTDITYDIVSKYLDPKKDVNSPDEAMAGALDIIAEHISDDADLRKYIRSFTYKKGLLCTKGTKDNIGKYQMYHDFKEPIRSIVSHRILAINRGEKEKFLKVTIDVPEEEIIENIKLRYIKRPSKTEELIFDAIVDAYKRLISPSIEREIRNILTEKAEEQALKVFSRNLKGLLLQPPVKDKVIMGFDPAYRTGCKIAVIDTSGKLLDWVVCYPTPPQNKTDEAKKILTKMINKYNIDVIALGNGTASRESELFLAELIRELEKPVSYVIVSEAGASVYSASKLATKELPDIDVSFRGAVSIARRLQDPLAELVKIDPKALGVGQYQHDVNQKMLSERLSHVVEDTVNHVGVDVNTASPSLLKYVSGISSRVAKNIVKYREQKGKILSRKEFLNIPQLGPKTFEQCAGFLRIPESENILDNTAVHPESYEAVEKLTSLHPLDTLKSKHFSKDQMKNLAKTLDIGPMTLQDILEELAKPGRDPRENLPAPIFRTDVLEIEDLKPGMILTGTVRNVTDFGAFIDIGVHQDGLCHISELSESFVHSPFDVVDVGDIVKVRVISVEPERNRISLSLK